MTDKVFGTYTPIATKTDVPGAYAGYPADKLVTAAEFNNFQDLLNQLRDNLRTGRVADISLSALSAINEVNHRYKNGRLELSENGGPWRRVAKDGLFDVMEYGAKGDGTTDDAAAIQAALDAAEAFITSGGNTYGCKAAVFFPNGTYRQSKPLFVPSAVTLFCHGVSDATLVPLGMDGYNLIVGRPADDLTQSHGPFATGAFAVSGQMTYSAPVGRTPDNWYYDLAQVPAGRLPTGSDGIAGHHDWTIAFKFKFDSTVSGSTYAPIWTIGGQLVAAQQSDGRLPHPTCLQIFYAGSDYPQGFRVLFRYNSQIFLRYANMATPPAIGPGSTVHVELSWDNTAKTVRFFLNGVLWPDGAFDVVANSGTAIGVADASGMVQYPWESNCIGEFANAGCTSPEPQNPYVPGTMSQFHMSTNVRHTANFTAPTSVSADGFTQLLLNFDQFYKGCLVGDGNRFGPQKFFFYPYINEVWETPQVAIKNLFLYGGGGIIGRFASAMYMENVNQLGPTDGWGFTHNGYFSKWINCSETASGGRMGFFNDAGSYCILDGCTFSGGIPLSLPWANFFITGCSISVHPNTYVGVYIYGGGVTDLSGISIDAEENSTVTYLCALFLGEPFSFWARTCTFYNPPNMVAAKPIVIAFNSTTDSIGARFDNCVFAYPPTSAPLIFTQIVTSPPTAKAHWTQPLELRYPRYQTALHTLCDNPENVIDTTPLTGMPLMKRAAAMPSSGYYRQGEVVWSSAAVNAGDPVAWYCTVTGSPATFRPIYLG
jgi:hypothetical protein